MKYVPKEDQRRKYLSHALVDVSGKALSQEQALQVISQMPTPLIKHIWVTYRANLPQDRYFSTGNLYSAPDILAHNKAITKEESHREGIADQMSTEDAELSNMLFQDAKKRGTLVTPKEVV